MVMVPEEDRGEDKKGESAEFKNGTSLEGSTDKAEEKGQPFDPSTVKDERMIRLIGIGAEIKG